MAKQAEVATISPITAARIIALNRTRQVEETNLVAVSADHKVAKQAMEDAEKSLFLLLDDEKGAGGKEWDDRVGKARRDHLRRVGKWTELDREKRSITEKLKGIHDTLFDLLDDAMEGNSLFDELEIEKGSDGWKRQKLADIVRGADAAVKAAERCSLVLVGDWIDAADQGVLRDSIAEGHLEKEHVEAINAAVDRYEKIVGVLVDVAQTPEPETKKPKGETKPKKGKGGAK